MTKANSFFSTKTFLASFSEKPDFSTFYFTHIHVFKEGHKKVKTCKFGRAYFTNFLCFKKIGVKHFVEINSNLKVLLIIKDSLKGEEEGGGGMNSFRGEIFKSSKIQHTHNTIIYMQT